MRIHVFGSLVCELLVDAGISLAKDGMPTKTVCPIRPAHGGGALNVAAAAQEYGAKVDLTLMVGNDAQGDQAVVELSERFASVRAMPVLRHTRNSVCFRCGQIYASPAERIRPVWDAALERSVRSARLTVVTPLPASERPLVQQLLATANRALFMPSGEQIKDVRSFINLANLGQNSITTICNDAEARLAINDSQAEPFDVIHALREEGLRSRIIITSRLGAMLWEPQRGYFWYPALSGGNVIRTIGAGDRASGLFAAAVLHGLDLQDALAASQIEAGRHVRNLPKLGSLTDLLAWGKAQSVVNLAEKKPASGSRFAIATGLAAAASALLAAVVFPF